MKKLFLLLIFILFFITATTFAAFNTEPVSIDFYFTSLTLPLSVLMSINLVIGIVVGACILYITTLKLRYENKRLTKRLSANEKKIAQLNNLPISEAAPKSSPTINS